MVVKFSDSESKIMQDHWEGSKSVCSKPFSDHDLDWVISGQFRVLIPVHIISEDWMEHKLDSVYLYHGPVHLDHFAVQSKFNSW